MGKVQRRDAGLVGGIPTQDMRPHMRLAHQSYAERGIAGRVGMRRSAAIRATCNGGQYRPRKPNTPLRKEVERVAGDPEGNLVIGEKCAEEAMLRRVAAQAKPIARAKRSGPKAPRPYMRTNACFRKRAQLGR